MATHNQSMTCIANEDMEQYSMVKLTINLPSVDGLPRVEKTDDGEDVIFGIAMTKASAGDRVTVRLPFSGVLPAYAYTNVKPGDGLTIGQAVPGSLSNNTGGTYARKVAYVVQTGGSSSEETWCAILFVRANYR